MKSIINYIVTPFPQLARLGYYISLFGIVLIMLWIGFFKFTPTEAAGINLWLKIIFYCFGYMTY